MATFDQMPIRNQEPAIVERLRLGFPAQTFTIERVPPVMSIDEFKRVVKTTPFIGLAWNGMKPDEDNGRLLKGAMNWRLILVNRVSNGLEARFKGDAREIGLDAMNDVAMVLLHGISFAGLGDVTVTGASSLIAEGWSNDDIAIAQIEFSVRFATRPAETQLITPDDFLSLGITWALPGSTHEEASDVVIREE